MAASLRRNLYVVWLRKGAWVAKPFTGKESWAELTDEGVYNEELVLVAALSTAEAERVAGDRPDLHFPELLVGV